MYIMALDYHQATPPAEVRFEGDHHKTRAMGPRKAPEAISAQKPPAQARAEIRRPIQEQRASMRESALAASGIKSSTVNKREFTGIAESKPLKEIGQKREARTQLQHPKNTVQGREKDGIYRATKYYSKLSSIKPEPKLKQPTGLQVPKHIDSDELLASIQGINALAANIKSSVIDTNTPTPRNYADIEAFELEDQQLQAAADAYDKQELTALVRKYPDSMRKKRAKIVSAPEAEGKKIIDPEALIASVREILALAQAKDDKKISQSAKNMTAEGESVKPQDVLAGMSDMDNHLERAFNAILNGQPDIADSARAALSSNFQFQALE